MNVTRNPRKRIGYRIAFKPSTNCSIITISRRVPDAQRRRFAGEKGRGRMPRKQIEIQQFGARIVSERAAATVPVLPVNYGGRPSCGAVRYSGGYRIPCSPPPPPPRLRDVATGYATIEHRDEGYAIREGDDAAATLLMLVSRRFAIVVRYIGCFATHSKFLVFRINFPLATSKIV